MIAVAELFILFTAVVNINFLIFLLFYSLIVSMCVFHVELTTINETNTVKLLIFIRTRLMSYDSGCNPDICIQPTDDKRQRPLTAHNSRALFSRFDGLEPAASIHSSLNAARSTQ